MKDRFQDLQRVMIIGQPGSGKSTIARELGAIVDLPVIHIDHIHWQSGWVERSDDEKDRLCAEVHACEKWIFEGGRSSTWAERLDRADALIWLDFRLRIRALRVFFRTLKYFGKTRPDLPDGCPERFTWEFIKFIWDTRNTGRALMLRTYNNAPAEKLKLRLCSRQEVDNLISDLSAQPHISGA